MPQRFPVFRDRVSFGDQADGGGIGLVVFTGIGAEVFGKLVRHVHEGIGIRGRRLFLRDVGPNRRVFAIEFEPKVETGFGVRLDSVNWAFRFADPAIDTFVGMNDQHVLALVETVHGADLDAIGVFARDAGFVDDVSHRENCKSKTMRTEELNSKARFRRASKSRSRI